MDRSTVMKLRMVAKEGALAASRPGARPAAVDAQLAAARGSFR